MVSFINGVESIDADEVTMQNDSIFIRMPVFDSEIRAKITSKNKIPVSMQGLFINHARVANNIIPFSAKADDATRFIDNGKPTAINFDGLWEVHFSQGTADSSDAIGKFEQQGKNVIGTFLTPTGDYRYLSGSIIDSTLNLSTFDGCHVYLFKAKMKKDGTLTGDFWSGTHWHEPWTATRNPNFQLPDPDTIMHLKPGYDGIKFSFLNMDSTQENFPSDKYKNKVVILQFMGTWCPNCMDETSYLAYYYRKMRSKNLEIVGLAFEKFPDFNKAKHNLTRLKGKYAVDYPLLIACTNNKDSIARNLPMLGSIYSFPTTIFIDKKGKVRRIHTGYSGPATGIYYDRWIEDFTTFVDKLIAE